MGSLKFLSTVQLGSGSCCCSLTCQIDAVLHLSKFLQVISSGLSGVWVLTSQYVVPMTFFRDAPVAKERR